MGSPCQWFVCVAKLFENDQMLKNGVETAKGIAGGRRVAVTPPQRRRTTKHKTTKPFCILPLSFKDFYDDDDSDEEDSGESSATNLKIRSLHNTNKNWYVSSNLY